MSLDVSLISVVCYFFHTIFLIVILIRFIYLLWYDTILFPSSNTPVVVQFEGGKESMLDLMITGRH